MDFGDALRALKAGSRTARGSWVGTFVVRQPGYPDGVPINASTAEATGIPQGTVCVFRPYLLAMADDGSFVPYVISQSDALAEDWECV